MPIGTSCEKLDWGIWQGKCVIKGCNMNSLTTTLAHDWKNRNYEDFHSPFFPEEHKHGHDYIRIRVFLSGKLGQNLDLKNKEEYFVANFWQIWSRPKKQFPRFGHICSVRAGCIASFYTVLSVFPKLLAINAESFLGWLPQVLHHQNEKKGWSTYLKWRWKYCLHTKLPEVVVKRT